MSAPPPPSTTRPRDSGFVDARRRGRLELHGRGAVQFLHALVSNDVAGLVSGSGCYAVWLTPQGRLITDMRIYHRGDYLLLDVGPGLAAQLAARLDQSIFSEDVRVVDVSETLAALGIYGDEAPRRLGHALGAAAGEFAALGVYAHRDVRGILIARTDETISPNFTAYVPADRFDEVVGALTAEGLRPLSAEFVDALRIEAGRPAFGIDMNEETIPLEAGLRDRAISMTKGCYVGQEVIVRILHRGGGRVVKRLVQLRFDEAVTAPPDAGTMLMFEGRETGRITSAAIMPAASMGVARVIALAYVHRDAAEIGNRVVSASGAGAEIVGFAG